MRAFFKNEYFRIGAYFTALFAAVYICKYLIDALVYALTNIGSMLNGLTLAAGRICEVFAIVLIGFLIAYILDPLVGFIQKKSHTSRLLAVSLLYFILILLIVTAIFAFIKNIRSYDPDNTANALYLAAVQYKTQFTAFYTELMSIVRRYDFFGLIPSLDRRISNIDIDCITAAQNIGKWLINIVLSLIIAFYYLKDKKRILRTAKRILSLILPENLYTALISAVKEVHEVFSGYIRGQLTDALIMSVLIASALSIMKLPFSVPIGIISGFTNIIPYFGAIMGLVLSFITALVSGGIGKAVLAAFVMLVLQQIDSLIIVPKVVGENVSLSPVPVIIALGVAGNLFGLWGMVFAVPTAALIKLFAQKQLKKLSSRKNRHSRPNY